MATREDIAERYTKKQIRAKLHDRGVSIPRGAKKLEVAEMLADEYNRRLVRTREELMGLPMYSRVVLGGEEMPVVEKDYKRHEVIVDRGRDEGYYAVNSTLGSFAVFELDDRMQQPPGGPAKELQELEVIARPR